MSICVAPPVRLLPSGTTPDAVIYRAHRWPAGTTRVTVRFLDGSELLRERVRRTVRETWNRACAVQFIFVETAPADVRVSFAGAGNWCYPGTIAQLIEQEQASMNLGSVTDSTMAFDVIQHEFGHALGLLHEQQSPNSAIPWDVPAVYAYYARMGWDKQKVDAHVLYRMGEEVCEAGAYDPASIMHYWVPPELVLDRVARGGAAVLSAADRHMVRTWYGPPPAQPQPHNLYLPIIRG